MKNNLTMIRVFVDRGADAELSRIATVGQRTKQRQTGYMIERLVRLFRENPAQFAELGFLHPPAPTQSATQ